eukprot:3721943-Prorocentrum_lima.AAC.1
MLAPPVGFPDEPALGTVQLGQESVLWGDGHEGCCCSLEAQCFKQLAFPLGWERCLLKEVSVFPPGSAQ